jgi:leucyl aminopeptidase (aminopeptidase T)
MAAVLAEHQVILAPTELSATAPLKLQGKRLRFRAATMPQFNADMIPALRLDWVEIDGRCRELKALLDQAEAARIRMEAAAGSHELLLDLRHRTATASGGLLVEEGKAGNLPSGETYIVPYEGEVEGDPSRSAGSLPIEMDGELLFYRIEGNRIVEVIGEGPVAAAERAETAAEPAYCNVAELGLGLLKGYGILPVGSLLLDEKLGLHIAFGRSDHFGGQTGVKDFTSPEKVIHIDRVYIPEVQPQVAVRAVDLEMPGGSVRPLMRNGDYV